MSAATRMFSRTVSRLKSSSRWNVRASPSRARLVGLSLVMSRPSRTTRPEFGGSRPVMTLKSVVLPAPFGPMSPVTQPGSVSRLTVSSATLPPNRTVTSRTSSDAMELRLAQADLAVELLEVRRASTAGRCRATRAGRPPARLADSPAASSTAFGSGEAGRDVRRRRRRRSSRITNGQLSMTSASRSA